MTVERLETERARDVEHELILARADLVLARSKATHAREILEAAVDDYAAAVEAELAAVRRVHSLHQERYKLARRRGWRVERLRGRFIERTADPPPARSWDELADRLALGG